MSDSNTYGKATQDGVCCDEPHDGTGSGKKEEFYNKFNVTSMPVPSEEEDNDFGSCLIEAQCGKICSAYSRISEGIRKAKLNIVFYVVLLGVVNGMVYANKFTVAAAIPYIKCHYEVGNVAISAMVIFNRCFFTIAACMVSYCLPASKHLPVMTWVQLLLSFASLASGVSHRFWDFMLAQALFAIGEGIFITTVTVYTKNISKNCGDYRNTSIVYSFTALGTGVGYFLGGLVHITLGWVIVFGVYSVVFAALCFLLSLVPRDVKDMGCDDMIFGAKFSYLEGEADFSNIFKESPEYRLSHGLETYAENEKNRSLANRYKTAKQAVLPLWRNQVFVLILIAELFRNATVNSIGFWMPSYIYTVYNIDVLSISIFLAIGCTLVGSLGTFGIGYLFEKHLKRVTSITKIPDSFTTIPEGDWDTFLKCYLSFEYILIFIGVGTVNTILLLLTNSYYAFCLLALIEIFCVFAASTPVNNLFMDVVLKEQHSVSIFLQTSLCGIFSDMAVIPLIGLTKEYFAYSAFVIIVIILLSCSCTYFFLSKRSYVRDSKLHSTWLFK